MHRSRPVVLLIAVLALALAGLACSISGPSTRLNAEPPTPVARLIQEPVNSPTPEASEAPVAPITPAAGPVSASAPDPAAIQIPEDPDHESAILEAIYEKVNPAVVNVFNLAHSADVPQTADALPQGEGSGFVWDTDGHIVTNDHVVRDAEKLQVTFPDGTTLDAALVGTDPDSDIAVIRVDPALVTLVPVEQGNIDEVKPGQKAIAIGNPFGFAGTMTQGIVSAVGRSIPAITNFNIPEAIQTDAAINPGNSGGPLLNERGQVIGINAQIRSTTRSSTGVGFAIPINIVQRVVPSLIKTGQYHHAYLGIRGGNYTRAWAQALGMPAAARGAYVLEVVANGPAARAGMRAGTQDTKLMLDVDAMGTPSYLKRGGDLVIAIDGHTIIKMDDVLVYLDRYCAPGQTIQVTVLRADGKQATISVRLVERPQQKTS
jgi:S1-C subfamily serine protease